MEGLHWQNKNDFYGKKTKWFNQLKIGEYERNWWSVSLEWNIGVTDKGLECKNEEFKLYCRQ